MAEGCCWYVVVSSPSGCSYLPDDIVTLPCAEPCEPRVVTDPGPCQGMELDPLFPECQPCEESITLEAAKAAARERADATGSDASKRKPLSAAQLRDLRKASL